mgnify:CR=1 FL=1
MKRIILASGSLQRKALLRKAGASFRVVPHKADERGCAKLPPRRHVEKLAERKAAEVASRVKRGIVIGADTILVCNGKRLGKPKSQKQALGMLRQISGRKVLAYSGVAVLDAETKEMLVGSEKSAVLMRKLEEEEIQAYLRTGEPIGKAGAIAVQGKGRSLVSRIEGSVSNVVGLPMGCLRKGLGKFGVKLKWRKE